MTLERVPTRLGRLPSDWRVMPLGVVAERIATPVEVRPHQHYREIGIRSHGKGLFHKDPVKGETLGAKRVFEVVPNRLVFNIVFAWEGAVAVTSAREQGMIASHRFPMFGPNAEQLIDVEFLRRFFQTELGVQLLGDASPGGAGRNRTLNQKFTSKIPVPVPPLREQKKIVAILSSVDDAIDATQAVIDRLAVVKKAMLAELLTRGLPGRHTKFKMTEIGEVPEEWDVVTLDECIEAGRPICYGILMPGKGHPGGVPVVKVKDIKNGTIDESNILLTTPELDHQYRRSRLSEGDILLTIRGTSGRVARVPASLHNANITQDTARLTIRSDLNTDFVFYALQGPEVQRQVQENTRGQAVKGINIGDVRKLVVTLPSKEEQTAIARIFAATDGCDVSNRRELTELRRVKAALMSVLLTGEVRVKPDEDDA